MVTVSSDRIDFKKPIPAGTIVELIGKVNHVGNTSLKVNVEIYIEQMYAEGARVRRAALRAGAAPERAGFCVSCAVMPRA